jgi:hypothetical protein
VAARRSGCRSGHVRHRIGAARKVKDGIEARESLASARAAASEMQREAAIAMAEASAGTAAVNRIAAAQQRQVKIRTQIKILARGVTKYVPIEVDRGVVNPWGFVRVLDTVATGAGDRAAISVGAGESDTAASGVTMSEIAALSAANDGGCRTNAEQLAALEQWADEVETLVRRFTESDAEREAGLMDETRGMGKLAFWLWASTCIANFGNFSAESIRRLRCCSDLILVASFQQVSDALDIFAASSPSTAATPASQGKRVGGKLEPGTAGNEKAHSVGHITFCAREDVKKPGRRMATAAAL